MASILSIGKKWRAQIRRQGAKPITKSFPTKKAAEEWARRIEADIDAGVPVVAAPTRQSVAYAIGRYRELREKSGRPVRDDSNTHYMANHLNDYLGDVPLAVLDTPKLIAFCQTRKAEGAGPYTCNMEVSLLGTMLRLVSSVDKLRLPDFVGEARPALAHLGLIGGGGQRDRRPTTDELVALFEYFAKHPEIGPPMETIIRVSITVGLRRGEIFKVLWSDFDEAQRLLMVRDRKDPKKKIGNDQWVPLIGEAFDLIKAQPRRPGKVRIFPWSGSTCSKYFTQACRHTGIVDLHFHDCRHEAASALIEAGWNPMEAKMVTGHRSIKNFERYVNLQPADVAGKVVPMNKAQRGAEEQKNSTLRKRKAG
jgi:integrase